MDALKDDNVEEILLRLPSWASLGHAVRASDRFRHIASSPDFLRCFRTRIASSSPRSFLGVFAQWPPLSLPVFHLAASARTDPGLVAVARSADFFLAGLEDDPAWGIHDCRNGRLLLSKGRSLTVYDPVSLRRIDISRPRYDPYVNGYIISAICLLDDGDAPFRIVTLQVDNWSSRRLRAVEYDSKVQEWRFHAWAADAIAPFPAYPTMYAAGRIFWNHDGSTDGTLSIMLDTRTMEFSMLPLPPSIATGRWRSSRYSIGDNEDGKCCLVCVTNHLLQVWLLREDICGGSKWEFEKEKPLIEVLAGDSYNLHHVGKVVAGLVIVWMPGRYTNQYHHYAIDLKNLSLKDKLSHLGVKPVYPFQLCTMATCCLDSCLATHASEFR